MFFERRQHKIETREKIIFSVIITIRNILKWLSNSQTKLTRNVNVNQNAQFLYSKLLSTSWNIQSLLNVSKASQSSIYFLSITWWVLRVESSKWKQQITLWINNKVQHLCKGDEGKTGEMCQAGRDEIWNKIFSLISYYRSGEKRREKNQDKYQHCLSEKIF